MSFKDVFKKIINSIFPDLNSIEGINSIPNKQRIISGSSVNDRILRDLQTKATEHKKSGRIDLSIACLEKCFYIMLESDYYYGDYAHRYIRYLKNDRQFDKARQMEKLLSNYESKADKGIPEYIVTARQLKTDFLEASYTYPADGETAKYRGRIFSISGKDKRFPPLTPDIEMCDLELYPYIYGISTPNHCKKGEEIQFSNRPFVDDRNDSEKKAFGKQMKSCLVSDNNEDEYYWIYENLPDLAPKSLSGYTRMKNSNSKNYQKIVEEAKKIGHKIK